MENELELLDNDIKNLNDALNKICAEIENLLVNLDTKPVTTEDLVKIYRTAKRGF